MEPPNDQSSRGLSLGVPLLVEGRTRLGLYGSGHTAVFFTVEDFPWHITTPGEARDSFQHQRQSSWDIILRRGFMIDER